MLGGFAKFGFDHFLAVRAAFGEDPDPVPKVVPNGKEGAGNKLANLRPYTDVFAQAVENEVIEQERIQHRVDDVASSRKGNPLGLLGAEDPEALQEEVQGDTDGIADKVGGEQADVVVEGNDNDVAAPKPDAAADQIFNELNKAEFKSGALLWC